MQGATSDSPKLSGVPSIRAVGSGERHLLRPSFKVGRNLDSHLRFPAEGTHVSREHAVITWRNDHWVLSDRGSTNGTYVDGVRVEANAERALYRGNILSFGDQENRFVLDEDGPPTPYATAQDGSMVIGRFDLLVLPNEAEDGLNIQRDRHGQWVRVGHGAEEDQPIEDGDVLRVAGLRWTLSLPDTRPETLERSADEPRISNLSLRFEIDPNGHDIHLWGTVPTSEFYLCPRAYIHLLLILAERRLTDNQDSSIPEREKGWLHIDLLCDLLCRQLGGCERKAIQYWVFQARRSVAAKGVANAHQIIESRRPMEEIRIGVREIRVDRSATCP